LGVYREDIADFLGIFVISCVTNSYLRFRKQKNKVSQYLHIYVLQRPSNFQAETIKSQKLC